jgi:hypothetical protein
MGVVGGALAALALLILYWFLLGVLDRMHFTVDEGILSAKFEPIPKRGMPRIPTNEIERIYVYQPQTDRPKRGEGYCYVQVTCRDGREITIATLRYEVALFVAQTLDSYLHDAPVIDVAESDSEDEDDVALLAESEAAENQLSAKG